MAIHFTTTDEASLSNGIKVLVFGRAGHGKTVLCSTAPRPIIISAEAGLLSLAGHKIPVAEITCLEDLKSMYQWAATSAEAGNFDTICLDSLTEIAEKLLNAEKKVVKDPRQAYGALLEKMTDIVRAFRDLKGKHVYFSAQQAWVKDEVTGVTSYVPAMPGNKFGQALPYFFDEVFCLRIGKLQDGSDYRYLQTQPDFQYDCKDRSGALDAMEKPDLGHCFDKMLQLASKQTLAPKGENA
jgi:hypothetical protein